MDRPKGWMICDGCGNVRITPQPTCPGCGSTKSHFEESKGQTPALEASELGWKPGSWYKQFALADGEIVTACSRVVRQGELIAVVYNTPDGRKVHVMND